jgi:Rrf2 family iron-sulfur cluster assembly transcriptional regulator
MFSKTCEYAIRAVVYISSAPHGDKLSIDSICEQIQAPKHFTAKILQLLSHEGIVSSQKGIHGGFYIGKEQSELPLIKIVTAIDGTKVFDGCGLGLAHCSEVNPCPMHGKFKSIRTDMKNMLQTTSVGELALKVQNGEGVLKAFAG